MNLIKEIKFKHQKQYIAALHKWSICIQAHNYSQNFVTEINLLNECQDSRAAND